MFKFLLLLVFMTKLKIKAIKNSFEYIRKCYGVKTLKTYKSLLNLSLKYEKINLDLKFLNRCKIYNVFPKFLRFKLYKKYLHTSTFYKAWQAKLLVNEIRTKKKALKDCKVKISELSSDIKNDFSLLDFITLSQKIKIELANHSRKIVQIHDRKLKNLGINSDLSPCDPNLVVQNFSSIVVPSKVKVMLAYGLDFCLPIRNLKYIQYFFPFEKLAASLKHKLESDPIFPDFIKEPKNTTFKYFYNFKPYKIFSPIFNQNDMKLLKQFASEPDIVVSKPDKGRGVVIVDKINYLDSMKTIISDPLKFVSINTSISK